MLTEQDLLARPRGFYQPGPPLDSAGRVVLRTYADITAAQRAEREGALTSDHEVIAAAVGVDPEDMHLLWSFAWAQGRLRHAALLKVISPALTGDRVAGLGRFAERTAAHLAAEYAGTGQIDIAAYSQHLAGLVTAKLTGISRQQAGPLSAELARVTSAEQQGPDPFTREPPGFRDYLRELVAARRKSPGGDLADDVMAAHYDTGLLSEKEMLAVLFGLWAAGTETVAAATGWMFLFLYAAGLYGHAPGTPEWRKAVIEETLRLGTPTTQTPRVAIRPLTLGGVDVAPGTQVVLRWAAANRDPAIFLPYPDQFRLDRNLAAPHLAFGHGGIHSCIGTILARSVMNAALENLLLPAEAKLVRLELAAGLVDGPAEAILTFGGAAAGRAAAARKSPGTW